MSLARTYGTALQMLSVDGRRVVLLEIPGR